MQAIFGARNAATINLVLEILILAGLYVGFYYARKKKFRPHHANIQTTMVLLNLVLILTIMIPSFYSFVILGGTTTGTVGTLMIVHAILGAIAEIVALYLVFSERFKIIPKPWRIKNIKPVMRTVLGVWTIVMILGIGIYYFRYLAPKPPDTSAANAPVTSLQYNANHFQIHAIELQDAVKRNSTPAIRRHTEHVINILVGKASPDYGDLDNDGVVEDPGDGTGILVYLQNISELAASGGNPSAAQLADQLRTQLASAVSEAQGIMKTSNFASVQAQIDNLANLGNQIAKGTGTSVPALATMLNVDTTMPLPNPAQAQSGTTTVDMQDFAFKPPALTVKKGTTVVFVNKDNAKHTVTADDKAYNSKDVDGGKSFSFTYDQPGEYHYYCEYHGDKGGVDMSGTIVVTE